MRLCAFHFEARFFDASWVEDFFGEGVFFDEFFEVFVRKSLVDGELNASRWFVFFCPIGVFLNRFED